ncbi:S8 family serine peptidase [Pseudarthrobacter sp. J64]|uniref:S8 family serine peptidase n=1 Tax=Pseudarthrobacter sp. J64 TaxID=3116485 RepID=UPI002E7FB601|nr:S8 family serine peptidase [Pseudarthrobacter sp. J64]MEE2570355.1 S8 family serine peptidase [Pseudarthrobacter sp. J64]
MRAFPRFMAPVAAVAMAAGLMAATALPATSAPAATAEAQTYIVLYKGNGVAAKSLAAVEQAGGSLVQNYPQIGVAIVKSDRAGFAASLKKSDAAVAGAASTAGFGVQVKDDAGDAASADEAALEVGTTGTGSEALAALQWDMDQIKAPEAQAINPGNQSVVVGNIDTGLDHTHPDLAPNIDFSRSVSCESGAPDTDPAAWMDIHGHGTHTAGTIAAAKNGIGMVGVAPNVKIAGIKSSNNDGYFFPEMVVCSFMWAAEKGIQVTNNSYYADPWLYNCKNDPGQRAIWEAERRAIRYAQSKGTTVVAAEGNASDDLSHPTQDLSSPDYPAGSEQEREISNACAVVPVEVPGVIGVTSNGNKGFKSYFSNYGVSTADVIAPGGDARQITPAATNGRVLSTWPSNAACGRPVTDATSGAKYCYAQGTSMASPHVAGVAALVVSSGVTNPGAVAARIQNTADDVACPTDMSFYDGFVGQNSQLPQVCQGGDGHNSFNGHGQVNALKAIGG